MLRRFLFLALLLPLGAFAQCDSASPEPFAVFLEKFGRDKGFAVTRTAYPLDLRRHASDENQEGPDTVTTRIPQAEDAGKPALSDYARANGLQQSVSSISATAATVKMEKPDTDWMLTYHFERKGYCWRLQRIEDHSL